MSKCIRHSNVNEVRLIEVIEVKSIRGDGTKDDPIFAITEYFLKDGIRLARVSASDEPEKIISWINNHEREERELLAMGAVPMQQTTPQRLHSSLHSEEDVKKIEPSNIGFKSTTDWQVHFIQLESKLNEIIERQNEISRGNY